MGIGTSVRHRLGRWERPAAAAYRSLFLNIDDLGATIESLVEPKRVLEIGCGDGALADRLTRTYPHCDYLGIDISPSPGRLFSGDPTRAAFRSVASGQLLAEQPEPFDLVVVVDVVHHVPVPAREQLLRDAGALTAPTGTIVVKEWEGMRTLGHALTYAADRYLSGDAGVTFLSADELRALLGRALPDFRTVCEARIPPHRNNLLLALVRPTDAGRR